MLDAIVVGLGVMGSAALAALARRGRRVLGLEQFAAGHDRGSSHGHTRVIRTAYFEHPAYVPLCRQAFRAWRDLERRLERRLLIDCSCLQIGSPEGELITGVRRAADEHCLAVESLAPADLRRRFPDFRFDDSYAAALEHEAGILLVDDCVHALLDDARSAGAEVVENCPVQHWEVEGRGVTVHAAARTFRADRLIVAAGPWAGRWLNAAGARLRVMRQVSAWLNPTDCGRFAPERFPVFLADTPQGCYYGIPATHSRGLKIAQHYGAPELLDVDAVERAVEASDLQPLSRFLRQHIPAADGPIEQHSVCVYTLSPDRHFIVDRLPSQPEVCVATGFSGHGFKFAPVVGEILADLADGRLERGPPLFRIDRWTNSA